MSAARVLSLPAFDEEANREVQDFLRTYFSETEAHRIPIDSPEPMDESPATRKEKKAKKKHDKAEKKRKEEKQAKEKALMKELNVAVNSSRKWMSSGRGGGTFGSNDQRGLPSYSHELPKPPQSLF